MPTVTAWRTT